MKVYFKHDIISCSKEKEYRGGIMKKFLNLFGDILSYIWVIWFFYSSIRQQSQNNIEEAKLSMLRSLFFLILGGVL